MKRLYEGEVVLSVTVEAAETLVALEHIKEAFKKRDKAARAGYNGKQEGVYVNIIDHPHIVAITERKD